MSKTLFTLILSFASLSLFSQIGIGTTTPEATLDIRATSLTAPTNRDGLLIPKINVFPTTNPTAQQQSMLVYLTTTSGGNPPGFYYWNNPTTSWLPFVSTASATSYWDRDASGYLFPQTTSDRVEINNGNTATGVPNTGGLEMDDRLRLDRWGLTTNTNSPLYMQYDNNGDFSVDDNSLYVDASANNVGIGTTTPDARLEIYNTTGTSRNLYIEKTTGAADAVLIQNNGTGAGLIINNNNIDNSAELFNNGNGRALYVYKGAGAGEAVRINTSGTGAALIASSTPSNNWAHLGTYSYAGHFNGDFRLTNGSEGTGKVLTSNATGVATWRNPSISTVTGTIGPGADIGLINNVQTGSIIILPPGRWAVNVTMVMGLPNSIGITPNNSSLWLRSSFTTDVGSNPTITGDIEGAIYVSGNFPGTSHYSLVSGSVIINNTSAFSRTYRYIVANTERINNNITLFRFGGANWGENIILAYRLD